MPSSSTRPTGGSSGAASIATPTASSTRSCRPPTMTSGWRPTGPCRIPRTTCAPISRPCRPRWRPPAWTPRWWWAWASTSRPARCCPPRPTARPSATLPELRRRTARLGQALEAPRRAAGGRPHQRGRPRARRGLAATLRRQDLVRVVLLQGPPDPRRGAGRLRRGGPAHRGRRLGRLATHRRRDAQQLHGRLQGHLVQAGRLPGPRLLRGARPAPRGHRGREDVAHHRVHRRARPGA